MVYKPRRTIDSTMVNPRFVPRFWNRSEWFWVGVIEVAYSNCDLWGVQYP